jgi:hypothetical protein
MAGRHRRSRSYDWWLFFQLIRMLVEALITSYGDGPGPRS